MNPILGPAPQGSRHFLVEGSTVTYRNNNALAVLGVLANDNHVILAFCAENARERPPPPVSKELKRRQDAKMMLGLNSIAL